MNCGLILLVTDAVGGVWTYSLELARALAPLGVQTLLAVTGPSPTEEQREAAKGLWLIETGLPLEWLDTCEAEVIDAGSTLATIARREGADIVQTSSAALLASATFDCATVAVQHSCMPTWWDAVRAGPLPPDFQWRRELVRRGLERADAVVAPSASFALSTRRTYGLSRPVLSVYNGRTATEMPRLPQGDFAFTAGRLWDEGKNVATLDRAAARVGAPFQAAGLTQGPNGASVSFDHLTMIGNLPEDRLQGVLASRPVYASAALYEPFGLSVLEAAQAGCALVLSDIATHRELWPNAAIFINPRDDRSYAAVIGELLGDRDRRNWWGERAREQALRYSPERMARGMAEIYARVAQPQLVAGAA